MYLFGYGALVNLAEIKEFEKKKRACPVMVNGLKRSLNVSGQKHCVFGVKTAKSAKCNGLLIKINEMELVKLEQREKLYTLKPLAKERIDFAYGKCFQLKPKDQIFYFAPQANYVLTQKQMASCLHDQVYVRQCLAGAHAIGDDFFQDFLKTTNI